jgi:hypothetical protein
MLGDYKKKIEVLNGLQLSNEEFDFLYMINIYKNELSLYESKFILEFQKYYEVNKLKYKYNLFFKKYEELGYIINLNKEEAEVDFTKIVIQDRFRELFITNIDKCWKEVIEIYPQRMYINDRPVMLQASTVDLKNIYYHKIIKGGDKFLHEEFISLTEWFYKGEKITHRTDACKLEKYLLSWENYKTIILSDMKGESKIQYNLF